MTRLVVELAGPAGAGKTTLVRGLLDLPHRPGLVVGAPRAQLVRGLVAVAPGVAVAQVARPGRGWSREDLRDLAYLSAWRQVVAGRPEEELLFDHGPVFRLARLAAGGPLLTTSGAFQRLWLRLAGDWAHLLGVVVWLDAPDAVLLERIAARPRSHRVRDLDPAAARDFLARYRLAYSRTLEVLAEQGVRVEPFDTSTCTKDQLVQAVAATLGTRVS